jgi:hypothetical protein
MARVRVSRVQAVNYRLVLNNLSTRLPAGSYFEAAYVGLQDTAPRDEMLGLHARVEACEPAAWQHPGLTQTYSPRAAVYVLPADDFGVFTVGRLPRDPDARQRLEDLAEESCAAMDGQEVLEAGQQAELTSATAELHEAVDDPAADKGRMRRAVDSVMSYLKLAGSTAIRNAAITIGNQAGSELDHAIRHLHL